VEIKMLTNVMYATLYVTDQDQAVEFYTDGLGMEKRADYSGPEGRFLTVGVPESPVEIILWSGGPASPHTPEGVEPGIVPGPVILESEDLTQEYEALRARGVTFEEPEPVSYPFGVRITALDPDGNRISLRQQRRRGRAEG
jgi:catechol 2,3-dioxygenase-like lactoylglutathione lyase family enzyme